MYEDIVIKDGYQGLYKGLLSYIVFGFVIGWSQYKTVMEGWFD